MAPQGYLYDGIAPPGESLPRWTWTFEYLDGKLDRIINPTGRVTEVTVNAWGRLTAVAFPDNSARQFYYDANHLLTQQLDENGDISQYEYDEYGRITSHTSPLYEVYDPSTETYQLMSVVRQFTNNETGYPLINDSIVGNPQTRLRLSRFRRVRDKRNLWERWQKWADKPLGFLVEPSDGLGRATRFERDENNNILRQFFQMAIVRSIPMII